MIDRVLLKAKSRIRDSLPAAWRVPAKYWHARMAGNLEPEMKFLPHLLTPGERMIDIGANYGLYAYAASRTGVAIELFEPNSQCLRALEAWAGVRHGIRVHSCALSAETGCARLSIPVERNGVEHDAAASIEPRPGGMFRVETVARRTLDSFAFEHVGFIKIDVEGHEAQVIEGARATINTFHPALLVEIEQRHRSGPIEEVFRQIASLGYAGYFLRDGQLTELAQFRVTDHQSVADIGSRIRTYHNNFLFLAHSRLLAGHYRALL